MTDPLLATFPSLRVSALVAELAADLRPAAWIWADHGITTRSDALAIMSIGWVRAQLDEARATWRSREGLGLRVKGKAGVLVEDLLPVLHAGVMNPAQPLSQRVAAFGVLAKMAGLEQPPETRVGAGGIGGVGGGVGISIVLDLGGSGGTMQVGLGLGAAPSSGEAGGDDNEFLLNPADYLVVDADEESE